MMTASGKTFNLFKILQRNSRQTPASRMIAECISLLVNKLIGSNKLRILGKYGP